MIEFKYIQLPEDFRRKDFGDNNGGSEKVNSVSKNFRKFFAKSNR